MKKFILACLVVSTIIACSPKTETASTFAAPKDLTFSSNRKWVGKYNIPVTFNGPDEFTQTISDTVNKVTSIKTYKRISK